MEHQVVHFNHPNSTSFSDVKPITIKKLDASRLAHFNGTNVNVGRSTAADFASSQWERVINRDHYTMNKDGTAVLTKARSTHAVTSNIENQSAAPIQEIKSSQHSQQCED